MILLVIYIFVIFFGKTYFSIFQLGIFFIVFGVFWSLFQYKNFSIKRLFQPFALIAVGILSILTDNMLFLQSFPLILAVLFFFAFVYAQLTKDFFLVRSIGRFRKITHSERRYLEKTHILWVAVSAVNVLFHIYFLMYASIKFWIFYVSVGWYILLGCGILFQIILRRYYNDKSAA